MNQKAFLIYQAIQRYAFAVSEQTRIGLAHGRTKRERRRLKEVQEVTRQEVRESLHNLLNRIGWGDQDERKHKMDLLLSRYDAALIQTHIRESVSEDLHELRRQLKELL